ncbi:MAG: SUF system NifU family Fe-S cluster assembly protein [Elusimicrobia bacterium]|nr:SUF system NifU family Fe-S cluster assembly protein [Elusimicrobiota bacterium]
MEGDSELQDLYRDVLLDYFRSRTHKGKAEPADVRGHGVSPICGDEVEVTASREGDRLARIRYDGHGCVISQASTAMMAEALEGKPVEEVLRLMAAFGDFMVRRGPPEALPEALEETKALEGVRKFPARVKCAMLSWNTLRLGLEKDGAEYKETEERGLGGK